MKQELIDVLDENGIKTGQILPRKEVHKKGLWHRAIVIAILNEKNEILIQQRSHNKEKKPDMWDISVAGHISSNEDPITASIREISEEVGVCIDEEDSIKSFRYMFSYRKEQKYNENFIERQFYDFFMLRQNNLTENDIQMQSSEVQAIKFVSISELNVMREKNLMVNRDECYAELESYLYRI